MGVLIIDQEVRARAAAMIVAAHQNPVTWAEIRAGAVDTNKAVLSLADRKPGFERPPSQHIILGTYRVAYSEEEQPAGMCRHLSVSTTRPGRVPNQPVVNEVMELFGFDKISAVHTWLEEFDPGHHAVNVVQLINPNEDTDGPESTV